MASLDATVHSEQRDASSETGEEDGEDDMLYLFCSGQERATQKSDDGGDMTLCAVSLREMICSQQKQTYRWWERTSEHEGSICNDLFPAH